MKGSIIIQVVTIILFLGSAVMSCSRFEKEAYVAEEDKALLDMIPSMVDAEYLLTHNDYGNSRPKLYIIEDLNNTLKWTKYDSIGEQDERALAPLLNSKLSKRKISSDLSYDNFDVKLLTIEEFQTRHEKDMTEIIERGGVLGYLAISRIVFDSEFEKGYMSFYFFCGSGCAWDSTIEIIKDNGSWKKNRFLFGGAA